jgi:outer membrane protein OmpA-like peptidoglycan-associated protein
MLASNNLTRSTYLFDEVFSAATVLKTDSGEYDKTFVLVLSDGQDISSRTSDKDAIAASRGTVPFYTIDYITEENEFMKQLAKETDGTYYRAEKVEGLRNIFESIAEKVVDKGYEVEFTFKAPPTASVSSSNSRVTVKEETVRETFPLLNYVFFDQGKPEPLARYSMFTNPSQTETFDEASIAGGALDHYLNILNIIGSRLLNHPEASITLTGYHNNYKEEAKAGKKLSRERAEIIKSYLVNTWRVLADSVKIRAGDLPKKASDVKANEGREENRRAEIESTSYDILKPVTFKRKVKYVNPTENRFLLDINAEEGIKRWQLNVAQGNQVAALVGVSSVKSVAWDWQCKDKPGGLPDVGVPLTYALNVEDNAGDTYSTQAQTINVEREQLELQKVDTTEGGVAREKVSLILFEFNSADPGPKNDRILEDYVYGRVTDKSSISVFGFTDIIGDSLYNQKLSDKRAKGVYDKLLTKLQRTIPSEWIKYTGYGESKPIFSNELPEGRFYNRTVQLEITNPKP